MDPHVHTCNRMHPWCKGLYWGKGLWVRVKGVQWV
jgi:hypothetical protein